MSQIEAIYRHGVFEPLQPVSFPDEQRVMLSVEPVQLSPTLSWLERLKQHHAAFIAEHGCLPDSAPEIAEDRLR